MEVLDMQLKWLFRIISQYMFIIKKQYGSSLAQGWFTWNGAKFVEINTPTLTKNFAGIGTRK